MQRKGADGKCGERSNGGRKEEGERPPYFVEALKFATVKASLLHQALVLLVWRRNIINAHLVALVLRIGTHDESIFERRLAQIDDQTRQLGGVCEMHDLIIERPATPFGAIDGTRNFTALSNSIDVALRWLQVD